MDGWQWQWCGSYGSGEYKIIYLWTNSDVYALFNFLYTVYFFLLFLLRHIHGDVRLKSEIVSVLANGRRPNKLKYKTIVDFFYCFKFECFSSLSFFSFKCTAMVILMGASVPRITGQPIIKLGIQLTWDLLWHHLPS